jgi:hypothetical protein
VLLTQLLLVVVEHLHQRLQVFIVRMVLIQEFFPIHHLRLYGLMVVLVVEVFKIVRLMPCLEEVTVMLRGLVLEALVVVEQVDREVLLVILAVHTLVQA